MATVASTAYGVYATKKNAEHQQDALDAQAKVQRKQIYDQDSVQANARMHQAQEERARLRAASAESGLSGVSITDMFNNVDFNAGQDVAQMQNNYANGIAESNSQLQSGLNRIQQPDYIAAGLQITHEVATGGAPAQPDGGDFGPPTSLMNH